MKPFSKKSLSKQTLLTPGAAATPRRCSRTFFLLGDLIMVRRARREPSATRGLGHVPCVLGRVVQGQTFGAPRGKAAQTFGGASPGVLRGRGVKPRPPPSHRDSNSPAR